MTEPQNHEQEANLQQVKQLCMQTKFTASRHLICRQAAGVNTPDPMKVSRDELAAKQTTLLIRGMLNIEDAFVSLQQAF